MARGSGGSGGAPPVLTQGAPKSCADKAAAAAINILVDFALGGVRIGWNLGRVIAAGVASTEADGA